MIINQFGKLCNSFSKKVSKKQSNNVVNIYKNTI